MNLEEIVLVPIKTKNQSQNSLSICGRSEAEALKKKYKVTIVGNPDDWQVDGVRYCDAGLEFRDFWPGGWSSKWDKVAKMVSNDKLFIFHSPFPVMEFYLQKFVKRFVFPKICIRYHSDVSEFSKIPLSAFILPALNFPCIMGSAATQERIVKAAYKLKLNARNCNWYVNHPTYIDTDNIDSAKKIKNKDVVIQYPAVNLLASSYEDCLYVCDHLYKYEIN